MVDRDGRAGDRNGDEAAIVRRALQLGMPVDRIASALAKVAPVIEGARSLAPLRLEDEPLGPAGPGANEEDPRG